MRRTKITTISWGTPEINRDYGKKFLLTEMSADEAEEVAIRVLGSKKFLLTEMSADEAEEVAIRVLGSQFPDAIMTYGMAGVIIVGVTAIYNLSYEEARPLWDKIMSCVRPIGTEAVPVTLSVNDVVEEVATRMQLRLEVLELHTGFSLADARRVLSDLARSAEATTEKSSTSPPASQPS